MKTKSMLLVFMIVFAITLPSLVLLPIISDAAEVRGDFLKDGRLVVRRPIAEPKDGRNTKVNEQPVEPDTIRVNIGIVGPSGQEIHNLLYPKLNDEKVIIPK